MNSESNSREKYSQVVKQPLETLIATSLKLRDKKDRISRVILTRRIGAETPSDPAISLIRRVRDILVSFSTFFSFFPSPFLSVKNVDLAPLRDFFSSLPRDETGI